MKARVKWVEGVSFVGESQTGHADRDRRRARIRRTQSRDAADGGRSSGAAACTAFDVVLILKKARQPIADCSVDAEAERAATEPKVFTKIHLRYAVAGRGLDPKQVERAVKLSKDKYCSATAMLAKTAEITFEIAIVDGDRVPVPPS